MTENSATLISNGKTNFSIASGSSPLPLFPIHHDQGRKSGLRYQKEDLDEALQDKALGMLKFPISEGGCGISQSGSFKDEFY